MRLWNKKESPVGGWKYIFSDDKGNSYTSKASSERSLMAQVLSDMRENGITPPPALWDYIEDQICTRQPAGKCFYESKAGDQIARAIHIFTGGIDAAASKIGISSNLEKRARTCIKCGQRRVKLNT